MQSRQEERKKNVERRPRLTACPSTPLLRTGRAIMTSRDYKSASPVGITRHPSCVHIYTYIHISHSSEAKNVAAAHLHRDPQPAEDDVAHQYLVLEGGAEGAPGLRVALDGLLDLAANT